MITNPEITKKMSTDKAAREPRQPKVECEDDQDSHCTQPIHIMAMGGARKGRPGIRKHGPAYRAETQSSRPDEQLLDFGIDPGSPAPGCLGAVKSYRMNLLKSAFLARSPTRFCT